MAKQNEVIGERTHENLAVYRSWLRKIGQSTYRFKVSVRHNGEVWDVSVDRSIGGRGRHWENVHHWVRDERG